jgi:hypothetical protein
MRTWFRLKNSRPARAAIVIMLLREGTMKITAVIFVLLALAMGTGVAVVASVHKEPVLLACGGPNC